MSDVQNRSAAVVPESPRGDRAVEASASTTAAIEAVGLTKTYGDFFAVREVSFSIPRGQLCAFLGPNGAGKSTTMKLLTGVMAPSSGRASICGVDVQQDRLAAATRLGYLPENGPLYPDMTPRALLDFFARARGLEGAKARERIGYVIDECRLGDVIGKPVSKLSKGYRQRVGMAQALLHDPDVMIMDEPTAGLDPNQVEHVRDLLRSLARTKTILLSTHILREVQAVAQRVIMVSQGRLVHDGPVLSLGDDERAMERKFQELTGYRKAG